MYFLLKLLYYYYSFKKKKKAYLPKLQVSSQQAVGYMQY